MCLGQEEILVMHYDPAYSKSIARNFKQADTARSLSVTSETMPAYSAAARKLIG
jgi:phosphatidylserine/phosphatidylglycerophosphate/cardiolipin synthase-like enzyme